MKRRLVAAVLCGMSALGLVTISSAPAQAASTQRICSSKNSEAIFYLYLANGDYYRVAKGDCKTVPLGTRVGIAFDSYKVGYGDAYSECRPGARSFTPWQKATRIYFRTYIDPGC